MLKTQMRISHNYIYDIEILSLRLGSKTRAEMLCKKISLNHVC